jgi:hypothetical protein
MTKPPTFRELLGLEAGTSGRSIHVDNTLMEFTVTGYSPAEVGELLASFRNHTHLMLDLAQQVPFSPDAVRYTPRSPTTEDTEDHG